MNVITGNKRSGKTTNAIRLANESDSYLVVHSKNRASDLYHSDNYPELDKFPVTYGELDHMHNHSVVIDDVDMYLQSRFDVDIRGVTMTTAHTTDLR